MPKLYCIKLLIFFEFAPTLQKNGMRKILNLLGALTFQYNIKLL